MAVRTMRLCRSSEIGLFIFSEKLTNEQGLCGEELAEPLHNPCSLCRMFCRMNP